VDIATLGIRIENGQIVATEAQLRALGPAGEAAAARIQRAFASVNQFQRGGFTTGATAAREIMASMAADTARMGTVAVSTGRHLTMLRTGFANMAAAAVGASAGVSRVSLALASLGLSNPVILGMAVVIGLAALALDKLTKAAEEAEKAARESAQRFMDHLKLYEQFGIAVRANISLRREQLQALLDVAVAERSVMGVQMVPDTEPMKRWRQDIAAADAALARFTVTLRAQREEITKADKVSRELMATQAKLAEQRIWEREKKDLQEAKQALVDLLGVAEKYRQTKAQIQLQQDKEEAAARQRARQAGGDIQRFAEIATSATDVQSLMSQLATLVPIFGGAISNLLGSLFGGAERAREAARRLQEAQEQFGRSMESFRASILGAAGDLDEAIRGVREQARQLRAEAEAAGGRTAAGDDVARVTAELDQRRRELAGVEALIRQGGPTATLLQWAGAIRREIERLEAVIAAMGEINEIERQRIDQLRAEAALVQARIREDLEVRRLRAIGRDEEADALAFAIAQQREYEDAVRDGADAATLAALAATLAAEAQRRAADQLHATIDQLTATISTLQDFANELRLDTSLTTLSPVQQLAEARRQYEAVLAQARGGDQAAAGRLPDAARAFLAASRAVNASGGRYQVDFNRVLADTDELSKMFTDQRTLAEKQLAVLERIREHVDPTIGGKGGLDRFDKMITRLDTANAQAQAGYEQITGILLEVRNATDKAARLFEGGMLN
jgi:hypothetical protein